MQKVITVQRRIVAPMAAVWQVLTNPEALRTGGLGLLRLDGEIRRDGRIALESASAPGRVFRLKVEECAMPRMVWSSGTVLFNGRRSFDVRETGGGTEFVMSEVYRGLMLRLIWLSMPDLQPGFEIFADGVKRLAERVAQ